MHRKVLIILSPYDFLSPPHIHRWRKGLDVPKQIAQVSDETGKMPKRDGTRRAGEGSVFSPSTLLHIYKQ